MNHQRFRFNMFLTVVCLPNVKNVYSESYCNMHIPNLIRGRKVNRSFLFLLASLGQ
jgi:hypothetical protein